jgi:hypothetical protein
MTNQQILPPEEFSIPQYSPKFSIKHQVVWANVEAHDHGTVIGCVWANQTSCKASGYHYLIQLAPTSASYSFCKQDWAFEQDIELAQSSSRSYTPADL